VSEEGNKDNAQGLSPSGEVRRLVEVIRGAGYS